MLMCIMLSFSLLFLGTESIHAKETLVNVLFLHNCEDAMLLQSLVPSSKVLTYSPRKWGPCPLQDTSLDPLHYHVFGLLFCSRRCAALPFERAATTLRSPWPLAALLCKIHKNKITGWSLYQTQCLMSKFHFSKGTDHIFLSYTYELHISCETVCKQNLVFSVLIMGLFALHLCLISHWLARKSPSLRICSICSCLCIKVSTSEQLVSHYDTKSEIFIRRWISTGALAIPVMGLSQWKSVWTGKDLKHSRSNLFIFNGLHNLSVTVRRCDLIWDLTFVQTSVMLHLSLTTASSPLQ